MRGRNVIGSPDCTTQRTFTAAFKLSRPVQKHSSQPRFYRNPLVLAQEWQQRKASGEVPSRAALAREMGVTRAHVTQVMRLLNHSSEVKGVVLALGDPMMGWAIGFHTLRSLAALPPEVQQKRTLALLARQAP